MSAEERWCGNASSAALLLAHGFIAALIAELVDFGLAMSTTERALARGRTVKVMRVRITDRGRVALERQ